MNGVLRIMLALMFVIGFSQLSLAAEHGGTTQEHGGTTHEHGGTTATAPEQAATTAPSAPSNDDIKNTMNSYVADESKETGTFDIYDPETGKIRTLKLINVHERVGKTGNYYYSCADFEDTESGEKLDLDIDVEDKDGTLAVADVRIHKVNGKERYTYDENDNRIPVPEANVETEPTPAQAPAATQEHGGKEHGGN